MDSSLFLTKDLLLQRGNLHIEKVELSNGFVFVREMTGHEKDVWEQSMLKKIRGLKGVEYETSLDDFRAKLAVVTLCDELGNLIFEPKDYVALSKAIRASDIEKIVETAQRINAVTEKDKEEILKNSETDLEDSSILGSV